MKKKIKLKKILIILGIVVAIFLLFFGYTKLHIKNIYVEGNNILSEGEIIEWLDLYDYPEIYKVMQSDMRGKLLKHDLVKEASVKVSLFGKVRIKIIENDILYSENNNYMLSNGKIISLDKKIVVPTLINEVDNAVLDKFINKMTLISKDILIKISEIEYIPSELDNERFMFYMDDGNYVYITLSKMSAINNYNEIYKTLEGNKGILYLDSGNHFEIKKPK